MEKYYLMALIVLSLLILILIFYCLVLRSALKSNEKQIVQLENDLRQKTGCFQECLTELLDYMPDDLCKFITDIYTREKIKVVKERAERNKSYFLFCRYNIVTTLLDAVTRRLERKL